MGLFAPQNRTRSERNSRIYAAVELTRTCADAVAALLFLVGSILFFSEPLHTPATWCFVFGSILFAARPVVRLLGELEMLGRGDVDGLAKRQNN